MNTWQRTNAMEGQSFQYGGDELYRQQQQDVSSIGSVEISKRYTIEKKRPVRLPPLDVGVQTQQLVPSKDTSSLSKNKLQNTFSALRQSLITRNIHKFKNLIIGNKYYERRLHFSHHCVIGDHSFDIGSAKPDKISISDPYLKKFQGTYLVKKIKRRIAKWKFKIKQNAVYKIITNFLEKWFSLIPVFEPNSFSHNNVWCLLIIISKLFFLTLIPVEIAFNNNIISYTLFEFTLLFIIILLFDIAIQFNTGFLNYGRLSKNRFSIFLRRVNEGIMTDLFSHIIVFIILLDSNNQYSNTNQHSERSWSQYIPLIYFQQLRDVQSRKSNIEMKLKLSVQGRSIYRIVIMVFNMVYVEHFFSCIWCFIGLLEKEAGEGSWLGFKGIADLNWRTQYLYAMYYSIVTLTTVGYGDIYPQTNAEMIFSIFFIIVSSIQMSYTLSQVGNIMIEYQAGSTELLRKLRVMNTYMSRHEISHKLQNKVTDYITKFWNESLDFNDQDHNDILKDLSSELRDRLHFETTFGMVQKIEFIHQNFTTVVRQQLHKCVEAVYAAPEDDLPKYNIADPTDTYLYYIDTGIVTELIPLQGSDYIQTKKEYSNGQHFGLEPFITGIATSEQYRSRNFCKLLRLSRKDVLNTLKEYPEELEFFLMKRDQVIYQHENFDDYEKCNFCSHREHSLIECPALHFIPDKEKIVKKVSYQTEQTRRYYKRGRTKKNKNSLLNQISVANKSNTILNIIKNPYELIYEDSESESEIKETLAKENFKHLKQTSYNIKGQKNQLGLLDTIREKEFLLWKIIIQKRLKTHQMEINLRFGQNELKKLELLEKKLKNHFNVEDEFDHIKNYNIYMPQNNFSYLFRQDKIGKEDMNHRLVQYMFYPQRFVNYFKKKEGKNQKILKTSHNQKGISKQKTYFFSKRPSRIQPY